MYLPQNIRFLRRKYGFSQEQVAEKLEYKSFTTIQKWESGVSVPTLSQLSRLAELFRVDLDTIVNVDLAKEESIKHAFADAVIIEMPESVMIPVYGKIKAGVPLEAIEDIEEHIDVPAKWIQAGRKIIGLRVDGNSMYPRYFHNDIVVIECDTDYYSGDDCAVYVNGYDATIKTIKLHKEGIELIPVNTAFPPQHYKAGEYSILGKVIEMRRRF